MMAAISQPEPSETLAWQIVVSSYRSPRAVKIRNKLVQGRDPRFIEFTSRFIWNSEMVLLKLFNVSRKILNGIAMLLLSVLGSRHGVSNFSSNSATQPSLAKAGIEKPAKTPSTDKTVAEIVSLKV